MITRLRISGFKSLVEVDLRLGPFTCIAGANGSGKSNLFDAIHLLSALAAGDTLLDAARKVRDAGERSPDIRSLFSHHGADYAERITFTVDLIIPYEGVDRMGLPVTATTTFVRYHLALGYHEEVDGALNRGGLILLEEDLRYIPKSSAAKELRYPHSKEWRNAVITGERRSPFISTEMSEGQHWIKVHQDGQQGRARKVPAENLLRTILSESFALESPTAALVRHEMLAWRLLQLEPTAMRRASNFDDPKFLGSDGSHLPATLYRLAKQSAERVGGAAEVGEGQIYSQIANRLAQLLEDVREVRVERDDKRELLTLEVAGKDGAFHAARSLSDGTLRFLALSVLEAGGDEGVICLEEPENGIHPLRIEPMIELLTDITVDAEQPADKDNPLRQVIINTHAPSVVQQIGAEALLLAELQPQIGTDGQSFSATIFRALSGTWRTKYIEDVPPAITRSQLLAYLNPLAVPPEEQGGRVIDRPEMREQLLLDFAEVPEA